MTSLGVSIDDAWSQTSLLDQAQRPKTSEYTRPLTQMQNVQRAQLMPLAGQVATQRNYGPSPQGGYEQHIYQNSQVDVNSGAGFNNGMNSGRLQIPDAPLVPVENFSGHGESLNDLKSNMTEVERKVYQLQNTIMNLSEQLRREKVKTYNCEKTCATKTCCQCHRKQFWMSMGWAVLLVLIIILIFWLKHSICKRMSPGI